MRRLRVLHVARNFPNLVLPRMGLWTERLVRSTLHACDAEVIAPVPYWPPVPGPVNFTRYRRVPHQVLRDGVRVHHPRFFAGPGSTLKQHEGLPFYAAIRPLADRLHSEQRFDVIHGHFVYPDGWAAAELARRYDVPLIVTEHASWTPWLDEAPRIRKQAMVVAARARFLVAVSRSLAQSMRGFADIGDRLRVIPNIVDDAVFTLPPANTVQAANRIIFVGLIRRVKGLDVLLSALRILLDGGLDVSLAVVGESFYGAYRADHEMALRHLAALGLTSHVTFLGGMPPPQVAQEIWRSRLLVLPSHRETFGTVLVEALACGRPVVATRCGGPEDIVNDAVGTLVDPDDPAALAAGITAVLNREYDPAVLREYAVGRFGTRAVGAQLAALYDEAVATALPAPVGIER